MTSGRTSFVCVSKLTGYLEVNEESRNAGIILFTDFKRPESLQFIWKPEIQEMDQKFFSWFETPSLPSVFQESRSQTRRGEKAGESNGNKQRH